MGWYFYVTLILVILRLVAIIYMFIILQLYRQIKCYFFFFFAHGLLGFVKI